MKKIFVILFSTSFLFTGCEKNELQYFDSQNTALNIWFGTPSSVEDELSYNFAYASTDKDSIFFHARLLGYPLDRDFDFELEAFDGDKDLVYYTLPKYTLKAGETYARLPIYFEIPDDYPEFKTETGSIQFRLKENNDVKVGTADRTALRVSLKNSLSKPDNWDEAPLYYHTLARYFGTYSEAKYRFIIEVLGKSYFTVYASLNYITEVDPYAVSSSVATYYTQLCKIELAQRDPIIDENTSLAITFP